MDIDAFVGAVEAVLPEDGLIRDDAALTRYRRNVSGFRRALPLALRPRDVEQVQAVVRAAAVHGVCLYPVGRGRNWGLGSRLPVRDGGVVLDFSAMDRIIDVDETFGIATVEPGVTQAQLAARLEGTPWYLDVTGSGQATSVLGNALERGVAYNSLRADLLQSLDVVLGTGECIRTGFGRFETTQVGPLLSYGVGPDLLGLFVQSNLGIVTQGSLALLPRPEKQATFLLSLTHEEDLPALFDSLRRLRRDGVVNSVVHVGNRRRSMVTLAPLVFRELEGRRADRPPTRGDAEAIVNIQLSGPWSAIGAISGTPGQVREARQRLRRTLGPLGRLRVLTPRRRAIATSAARLLRLRRLELFLSAVEPLMGLAEGKPTDAALHSTYWPVSEASAHANDPDRGDGGILFGAPVVPLEGQAVRHMLQVTHAVTEAHGFAPAITLNLMSARTLEGVVSIDFDRRDDVRTRAAQACVRSLNEAWITAGFTPYRVDLGSMDLIAGGGAKAYRTALARLKQALDPATIIAPGRYGPG